MRLRNTAKGQDGSCISVGLQGESRLRIGRPGGRLRVGRRGGRLRVGRPGGRLRVDQEVD